MAAPLLLLLGFLAAWLGVTWFLMSSGSGARRVRRTVGQLLAGLLVAGFATLSALGVGQALDELGPSWRAATGGGTAGSFTAESMWAGGPAVRDRQWRGTFVSTDRSVVRRDVKLADVPVQIEIGSSVPARDTGGAVVYGAGFPTAVLGNLVVPPVVVLVWGLAGWFLVRRLRRRAAGSRRESATEAACTHLRWRTGSGRRPARRTG
ncbi:hypothetical protein ACFP2T_28100 [Plantactinospora solaniradicis]|uniref:DUF3592 domain-containing protein n=1 Tax=Plantactinospora solaniradicis TaxID=1723736 RepID=A0ABW1KGS1_9ACTN